MKIGCAAWCFTKNYHAPYEEAIDIIGRIGFEGLELIVSSVEELNEYYTRDKINRIRKLYCSYNLQLSQFVLFHDLVADLSSFDLSKKKKSLEIFRHGVKVAKYLGTRTISFVSHWLPEIKSPLSYPPLYIHPYANSAGPFEPKLGLGLMEGYSWKDIWENYIDSIKSCVDIVKEHDMFLAVEGHTNVIVSSTDGFLRLFDCVPSSNLGMNFDTSWQLMQREYLPLSIHKLKNKVFNVHVRDGDGLLCYNLPVGMGIIDWNGFLTSLKDIGYDGFLSIEMSGFRNPKKYVRLSMEYLKKIL